VWHQGNATLQITGIQYNRRTSNNFVSLQLGF
jgi:hypothetical protein